MLIISTALSVGTSIHTPVSASECEKEFVTHQQRPLPILRDVIVTTSPIGVKVVLVPSESNKIYGIKSHRVITPDVRRQQEADKHVASVVKFQRFHRFLEQTCFLATTACFGAIVWMTGADRALGFFYYGITPPAIALISALLVLQIPDSLRTAIPTRDNESSFRQFFSMLSQNNPVEKKVVKTNPDENEGHYFESTFQEANLLDEEPIRRYAVSNNHKKVSPMIIVLPRHALDTLLTYLTSEQKWTMQPARSYRDASSHAQDFHPRFVSKGILSPAILQVLQRHFEETDVSSDAP